MAPTEAGQTVTARQLIDRGVLKNEFGEPLRWVPEVHDELSSALCDPTVQIVILTSPRQSGKSTAASFFLLHRLLGAQHFRALFVAASIPQAQAISRAKFRIPLERSPFKEWCLWSSMRLRVERADNELEIVAANEATLTGRTASLVVIDEAREIDEGVFAAILPTLRARPESKCIITTTAGATTSWVKRLIDESAGDPTVQTIEVHHDWNPSSRREELSALDKLSRRLFPALMERELSNRWVDISGGFLPVEVIDGIFDSSIGFLGKSKRRCFCGIDLSLNRDKTSIAVVEATDEGGLRLVRLEVYDPQKDFPSGYINPEFIAERLRLAFSKFRVVHALIDARSEVAYILSTAAKSGWPLRPIAPTVQSNATGWGALAELATMRRLKSPPHPRLREELLNLKVEDLSGGRMWRVVDAKKRIHRDAASALMLAIFAASERMRFGVSMREPTDARPEIAFDRWQPDKRVFERETARVEAECSRLEMLIATIEKARKAGGCSRV